MRTRRIAREESVAARWAVRLAVLSLTIFLVVGLSQRFGLTDTLGFVAVMGLVVLLALSALVLAGLGFRRLWLYGERAGGRVALATLLALIALSPVAAAGWWSATRPMLHDISTDTVDPPPLDQSWRPGPPLSNPPAAITPARAEAMIAAYPTVTGRRYAAPVERVAQSVDTLVEQRGWRVLSARQPAVAGAEITIQAVATTLIFGFVSDVAIRVTDEGETTYVDMRSASRFGGHDLGDNARRIDAFLTELDAAVAAGVGPDAPAQAGE